MTGAHCVVVVVVEVVARHQMRTPSTLKLHDATLIGYILQAQPGQVKNIVVYFDTLSLLMYYTLYYVITTLLYYLYLIN